MVDRGTFTNMMNDLSFVDERVRTHAPVDSMTPLGPGWQPDKWSVICARGKDSYDHCGNRRFRVLVDINLEKYAASKTKIEKSIIVVGILDTVRDASKMGGFVKQDPFTKGWFEVGDKMAREKIGQAFRAVLSQQREGFCTSPLVGGPVTKKRRKSRESVKKPPTTSLLVDHEEPFWEQHFSSSSSL